VVYDAPAALLYPPPTVPCVAVTRLLAPPPIVLKSPAARFDRPPTVANQASSGVPALLPAWLFAPPPTTPK
jgi:hypothetical protein